MSGWLYAKGRNRFAKGEIRWNSGGSPISAVLVSSAYAPVFASDEFLSDIPERARVASGRLNLLPPVAGVCDAEDLTLNAVSGDAVVGVALYVDSGVPETSALVCYIEGAIYPNGGDITVRWDDGVNRIFKL